jgi:hypothetical protein
MRQAQLSKKLIDKVLILHPELGQVLVQFLYGSVTVMSNYLEKLLEELSLVYDCLPKEFVNLLAKSLVILIEIEEYTINFLILHESIT